MDRTRFGVYLGTGEGDQDFHHLVSLVAQSYQGDQLTFDSRTLTAGGLRTAQRANASYRRARERLLGDLSDEEIEQLDSAVHRLLDVLSEDGMASDAVKAS